MDLMVHYNTSDTHAQCGAAQCMYNKRPENYGAGLETSFQPSLCRLYQSFRCRLHQSFRPLVAVTPVCALTRAAAAGHAMAKVIARLCVAREIIAFSSVTQSICLLVVWW